MLLLLMSFYFNVLSKQSLTIYVCSKNVSKIQQIKMNEICHAPLDSLLKPFNDVSVGFRLIHFVWGMTLMTLFESWQNIPCQWRADQCQKDKNHDQWILKEYQDGRQKTWNCQQVPTFWHNHLRWRIKTRSSCQNCAVNSRADKTENLMAKIYLWQKKKSRSWVTLFL